MSPPVHLWNGGTGAPGWVIGGDAPTDLRRRLRRARRMLRAAPPSWRNGQWKVNDPTLVASVRRRWTVVLWRSDDRSNEVRRCRRCGYWLHGRAWGTVTMTRFATEHEERCWNGRLFAGLEGEQ